MFAEKSVSDYVVAKPVRIGVFSGFAGIGESLNSRILDPRSAKGVLRKLLKLLYEILSLCLSLLSFFGFLIQFQ